MARNVAVGWAEVREMVAEVIVELSAKPAEADRAPILLERGPLFEGVNLAEIKPYRARRLDG